jgi:hypothetical protein
MKALGSICVRASLLSEAVLAVVPRRRKNSKKKIKPYPISLIFFEEEQALGITEAYHALRGYRVPASGRWPAKLQIDGQPFPNLVSTYPKDAQIELIALDDALAILYGKSRILLKRLDPHGTPGIQESAPPRDKKHFGPVSAPPDRPPSHRFEWNDTWLFSARVPFPQHRIEGSADGSERDDKN